MGVVPSRWLDHLYGMPCLALLEILWAKTIKKNTNSTQNKSQTHHAKQYEVTSFLSTDCELSTETCSKNVYSLDPMSLPAFRSSLKTHLFREAFVTLL